MAEKKLPYENDQLDIVVLLKDVLTCLEQIGLQDVYIDYDYSESIKLRVKNAILMLRKNKE